MRVDTIGQLTLAMNDRGATFPVVVTIVNAYAVGRYIPVVRTEVRSASAQEPQVRAEVMVLTAQEAAKLLRTIAQYRDLDGSGDSIYVEIPDADQQAKVGADAAEVLGAGKSPEGEGGVAAGEVPGSVGADGTGGPGAQPAAVKPAAGVARRARAPMN